MPSDPTPTASHVRAAADAFKAAIDAHLEAVERRAGENDPVVQSTYEALRQAGLAYDDLLFDVHEEVTPFEVSEPPLEEAVEVTAAEGGERRIALLARHDFTVSDGEAVVDAGRAAYRQTWPDEGDVTADEQVAHLGAALYELASTYGTDWLEERAEDVGLVPEGSTTWVLDVEHAGPEWRDAAFATVESGRVLYRLDEVYDEDDDDQEGHDEA